MTIGMINKLLEKISVYDNAKQAANQQKLCLTAAFFLAGDFPLPLRQVRRGLPVVLALLARCQSDNRESRIKHIITERKTTATVMLPQ